ncbi:MAG TPA: dihydrolipoyllysine-residue succinyltransferase [Mariprofundaceae bacterium]|nr:dihydrolipoyllysine-residue succinyltransferase [Mariprofundaceae bacterium]
MADIEIKVPSLGESESEATLVSWLKQKGDEVAVDDVLAEIESDKITMEITAFETGVLKSVLKEAGATVEPGEVIGLIDTSVKPAKAPKAEKKPAAAKAAKPAAKSEPARMETKPAAQPEPAQAAAASPKAAPKVALKPTPKPAAEGRLEERVPMSGLRRRIATRLKEAQNTAAMLTTFNEVNLQAVAELRSRYGDAFQKKYGIKLGYMSFFVRAVCEALGRYPALNAYIENDEIVYHNYADIGIAVSTDKGLVVPVLRGAENLSLAAIEKGIADLAVKARDGGLMPDDLKGGTFSITNGGVFGSLLSTPILNPPQSGILGMHAIQKRPVVENDEIVIRPMMYLALSYDHRLIDGADAVRFLVVVKEALEYPGGMLLDL